MGCPVCHMVPIEGTGCAGAASFVHHGLKKKSTYKAYQFTVAHCTEGRGLEAKRLANGGICLTTVMSYHHVRIRGLGDSSKVLI